MVKHNNVIPNQHFKKDWKVRVKTWFNQPGRKLRRRQTRIAKAKAVFPRPTAGSLRPLVHGQTVRYNMKIKLGRGFTLDELKAAGIPRKLAPTIGIPVDHRRRNRTVEGMDDNVKRLKAYKAKLVVFPRNAKKAKAGDAPAAELKAAAQLQGTILPPAKLGMGKLELVPITAAMKAFGAYRKLRVERMNERVVGLRKKKADAAAKEEEAAKK